MTKQQFLYQAVLVLLTNWQGDSPESIWQIAEGFWNARPASEKKAPVKRFVKPTIDEVRAYIKERGYKNFTAEKWMNFYESKGWKIGKNPMKDWKAAVRTWGEKDSGTGSRPLGFV